MARTIVGLFDRWEDARAAVGDIQAAGLGTGRVSIIRGRVDAATGIPGQPHDVGEAALDGAGTGALSGAMIGTGAGLLTGLGLLAIPGIGPVAAAGPILAGLTGAGLGAAAGAVTGGLVGALSQVGVPEHEVGYYEEGVRRGGTLVVATCDEREVPLVVDALRRHNGSEPGQSIMEYPAGDVGAWSTADAYRYAPVETGGSMMPPESHTVTPTVEDEPRSVETVEDERLRQRRAA
jgi:hypothetical protein